MCSFMSHHVEYSTDVHVSLKLWVDCKVCILKPHSFHAACVERGDNLINFQWEKKRKKIEKQKEEVVDQT